MKHRLYLAGPMTGRPDYYRPAFNAMAAQLRAAGYFVVNPADAAWIDHMRRDIARMMDSGCECIALLPDYFKSKGAMVKLTLATGLEFDIKPAHEWLELAAAEAAA